MIAMYIASVHYCYAILQLIAEALSGCVVVEAVNGGLSPLGLTDRQGRLARRRESAPVDSWLAAASLDREFE